MREIYLRPFEIALKTSRKTILYAQDNEGGTLLSRTMRAGDFVMAGDSAIGGEWCAANYALLMRVLRGEWGFEGMVVSDMHNVVSKPILEKMIRSGCDALMSTNSADVNVLSGSASPTTIHCLRTAVKRVCYRLVNSNLMQGIPPATSFRHSLSNWRIALIIIDGIVILLLCIATIFCFAGNRAHRRRHSNGA